MNIDQELVKIVFEELGKKSADLFTNFFQGSPKEEQVKAVRNILSTIVGESRTTELLKKFEGIK